MNKEILTTFIKKYSLGDLISKVKWKYSAKDKTLHTRATSDNKSFILDVVMNDFSDFGDEDAIICIGDTKKVKGMMNPFGDEISLSINKSGDRVLGITISDKDCESYCSAADPTAMDPVPKNLQDIPEFHVEVNLTEDFVDKFSKAKTALQDVDAFTIAVNKKKAIEFVLGYTTANSNRIRITPSIVPDKDKLYAALSFPISNLYEVLKANSDMPDGLLSVNNMGIMKITFKNEKYTCTYYQFASSKKV